LYIQPDSGPDACWAAERILKSGSCGGLLYWADSLHPLALKRLHLAAHTSQTLFFVFRPLVTQSQPSPAPLRLLLEPSKDGNLNITILKRRGAQHHAVIPIDLAQRTTLLGLKHGSLDRTAPAYSEPGSRAQTLAH
jgi:protein ImuA